MPSGARWCGKLSRRLTSKESASALPVRTARGQFIRCGSTLAELASSARNGGATRPPDVATSVGATASSGSAQPVISFWPDFTSNLERQFEIIAQD